MYLFSFWLLRRSELNVFDVTFGNLKQTIGYYRGFQPTTPTLTCLNLAKLQAQTPQLTGATVFWRGKSSLQYMTAHLLKLKLHFSCEPALTDHDVSTEGASFDHPVCIGHALSGSIMLSIRRRAVSLVISLFHADISAHSLRDRVEN